MNKNKEYTQTGTTVETKDDDINITKINSVKLIID